MRPLLLTMQAFGPYTNLCRVNFASLGHDGMYLITGETGAGKTMLFDGVTFALYGESSGRDREPVMLRSKQAAPKDATWVELVFLCRGELWRVRRTLGKDKIARDGTKAFVRSTDAELVRLLPMGDSDPNTCPVDTSAPIVTKAKDVTKAVESLLGLTRDQFRGCAMIAQGEFQSILHASTGERLVLFRKLFGTHLYDWLTARLSEDTAAARAQYEEARQAYLLLTASLRPDNPEGELSLYRTDPIVYHQELTTALANLLTADRRDLTTLSAQIQENETQKTALTASITKAEADGKLLIKQAETEKALRGAEKSCQVAEEALARLADTPAIVRKKREEAAALEALLPLCRELSTAKERVHTLETQLQTDGLAHEKRGQRLTKIKEKLALYRTEAQTAGEARVHLGEAEQRYRTLTDALQQREDVLSAWQQWQRAAASWESSSQHYRQKSDIAEEADREYRRLEKAYLDGQAGILAAGLQEGMPCPVCGSIEHPAPAIPQDGPQPTEEMLRKAREKQEKARQAAAEASHRAGVLRGGCESAFAQFQATLSPLHLSLDPTIGWQNPKEATIVTMLNNLREAIATGESERQTVQQTLTALREESARYQDLTERMERGEALYTQETEQYQESEKSLSALGAALTGAREQVRSLLTQVPDRDTAELEGEIEKRTSEATELESTLTRLTENRALAHRQREVLTAQAEELATQAKDETYSLLPQLLADRQRVNRESETLRQREITLLARLETNGQVLDSLPTGYSHMVEAEQRYRSRKRLADTASGSLNGREKIPLETFAQLHLFDRVLRCANLRLLSMSDGRYELRRREESANLQAKTGLELDVMDHHTGTTRDVRTLSGGESFLASLSLALGLADETESVTGGVRIDAMFLDEGFGTLDTTSLDTAITTLSHLSAGNRLIGIISHVTDLRDRIPRQVQVTRTYEGSMVHVVQG